MSLGNIGPTKNQKWRSQPQHVNGSNIIILLSSPDKQKSVKFFSKCATTIS